MGRSCIFDAVAAADGQEPAGLVVEVPELGRQLLQVERPVLGVYSQTWRVSISARAVSSTEEFRAIVRNVFDDRTREVSFASDWIEHLLNIQKLS